MKMDYKLIITNTTNKLEKVKEYKDSADIKQVLESLIFFDLIKKENMKIKIIYNETMSWVDVDSFLSYLEVQDKKIYESKGYNYQDIKHEKYLGLFIAKSCYSDFDYILKLDKPFTKGMYLTDNLLSVGNVSNRYIEIFYDGKKFDKDSLKIAKIEKKNVLRKISVDFFTSNPETLKSSILNSIQTKMLLRGIAI